MSKGGRIAAQRRYHRDAETICHECGGTGRILHTSIYTRARKGGNSSYLKSLLPGHHSMVDRGKRGGRPRNPRLADLVIATSTPGSREPKETGT